MKKGKQAEKEYLPKRVKKKVKRNRNEIEANEN